MLSRRDLLRTSAMGLALSAAPAGLKLAFGATGAPLLVVIFLRGAADMLSLVAPSGNAEYQAARPTLAIPASGTNAGLPLAGTLNGQSFRLHPAATGLAGLADAGQLAIVHAVGLPAANRSHFASQEAMDRGTADGEAAPTSGWLTRHLERVAVPGQVPIVAAASEAPMSLLGETRSVSMPTPSSFRVSGGARNQAVLMAMAQGSSARDQVVRTTLDAVTRVSAIAASPALAAADADADPVVGGMMEAAPMMRMADPNPMMRADPGPMMGVQGMLDMEPRSEDPETPEAGETRPSSGSGGLATALKTIADLARAEIGLTVATADFGGWDTHDNEASRFNTQVTQLSTPIAALHADLAALGSRLTVVVMSEFGRRLVENQNRGTDHGHGSAMLVSGVGIKGGLYGSWPGLKAAALVQGLDLAVTTDYRQVLAEVLATRCGQTRAAEIFPTVGLRPLGLA
jgi:uncharacterized protein (DUF1501 family)